MRTIKAIIGIMCIVVLSSSVALANAWHIETVDTTGAVGLYTSIALDTSDNPHISYNQNDNGDLNYAYYDGSSWQIESVDTAGDVGYDTSIALDTSDNPYISYYDDGNTDLKYANYDGSFWQIESVDTTGDVGSETSIALDTSDNPHISYCDAYPNNNLKYAYYDGSSWQIESVDTAVDEGRFTSIALDTSDNPHISYQDYTNYDLKYACYDGSSWQIKSVDTTGSVGWHTSIALDTSDNPHISYYDGSNGYLKYAYYDGSSWQIESVDTTGDVGGYTSIALDTSDAPHISYYDGFNLYLKYAYYDGSSWQIESVDTTEGVGQFTSIDLDTSDNPHISYWDETNANLKYAWYGEPPVDIFILSFSAQSDDATVALEWSVQTTEGQEIAGFNLYRRPLVPEGDPAFGGVSLTPEKEQTWTQINPTLITGENPYAYTDSDVESGVAYEYKLEAVLDIGAETLGTTQATAGLPTSFAILALYPNPATDTLTCLLALPSAGAVELALYDISGRLVIERRIEATEPSEMEAILDVSGLASGVYTLRASMGNVEVSPACGGGAVVVR